MKSYGLTLNPFLVALKECLDLRAGESFVVLADAPSRGIGRAFFDAGRELGAEAIYTEIIPRRVNGEEPTPPVTALWQHADVFVAPASKSMTHTHARRKALQAGARGATLPGVTVEMMNRCLSVDYARMAFRAEALGRILTEGRRAVIRTAQGTHLTFSLANRRSHADIGLYRNPGDSGNLPAGEVFIAPVEGTAKGTLVVDGAMLGVVREPIRLVFEAGLAREISGGEQAAALNRMLDEAGPNARNCAEFGIGINEGARVSGLVLEDEKIFGTIHIALGNSVHFGGTVDVPLHVDGIVFNPTVEIDGKVVIRDGEHLYRDGSR